MTIEFAAAVALLTFGIEPHVGQAAPEATAEATASAPTEAASASSTDAAQPAASAPTPATTPSAEDPEAEFFSLTDQLNAPTAVASLAQSSVREAPGVLTIINHDEIMAMGARDLLDVLWQVPGFVPALDGNGNISLGVRNNWGQEGKILLLVDGQELNDTGGGNIYPANHFPLTSIKTIEIIRGPGSVIYGGHALLAVIRITTIAGDGTFDGASASATYGQTASDLGTARTEVAVGKTITPGINVSALASLGYVNQSSFTMFDLQGNAYSMPYQNAVMPKYFNVNGTIHGLSLKLIYDNQTALMRDGFGPNLVSPQAVQFNSYIADASYVWKLSDKVRLTPRLNWRRHQYWLNRSDDPVTYWANTTDRVWGRLLLQADLLPTLNLMVGLEGHQDLAYQEDPSRSVSILGTDGTGHASYTNFGFFTEAQWQNFIVNVNAGVRLEYHSVYGLVAVPRLSLTRKFGDIFHFKLLGSRAYRSPDVQQVSAVDPVSGIPPRPEFATVLEAEVGVQPNEHFYLGVNAFDITLQNPLIFTFTEDFKLAYVNREQTGSLGAEAVIKVSFAPVSGELTYSYANSAANPFHFNTAFTSAAPTQKNLIGDYSTPDPTLSLGFPGHKVTGRIVVRPAPYHAQLKNFTITPSFVFMSRRYAYTTGSEDADGNFVAQQTLLEPTFLLNCWLQYKDLLVNGLDVSMGFFNLLNQRYVYPQPYAGGHAPLPGQSREFVVRVNYTVAL